MGQGKGERGVWMKWGVQDGVRDESDGAGDPWERGAGLKVFGSMGCCRKGLGMEWVG